VGGTEAAYNAKTALKVRHGIAENPLSSSRGTGCRPADNRAVSPQGQARDKHIGRIRRIP
jgi:hypothetical protein